MNLHDIVRRCDRMPVVEGGSVEEADVKAGGNCRAVDLARGTCMRLVDVHEVTALRAGPTSPGFALTGHIYERWCRYTQPENAPEPLRVRDYSIYVNYIPESSRLLFDLFTEPEHVAGMHLFSVRNGKDVVSLIAKP